MNFKKTKIIATFIIFALMSLFHFAYNLLPNTLFAILFPVNESIFEHMKLIFTTFIIYAIIDYFLLKKFNLPRNNFFINILVSALSCIGIFLLIWLPIYYKIGENMIITFIFLFIAIIFSQVISYYILKSKNNQLLNYISIVLIILIMIVFAYFTYYPLYNDFFFDPMEEKYGINTYLIN